LEISDVRGDILFVVQDELEHAGPLTRWLYQKLCRSTIKPVMAAGVSEHQAKIDLCAAVTNRTIDVR
jgi:hypothetical protein